MEKQDIFRGRSASLLTKHGKETVIVPAVEKETGCKIQVESAFDTDVFGTFTLDVARPGTQLETARLKAKKGMELLVQSLGLSSEGSFGPHPLHAFIPWNRELVLLVDSLNNVEFYGEYSGSASNYGSIQAKNIDQAYEFAKTAGFPSHYLIVSAQDTGSEFIKGISSFDELSAAVQWAIRKSSVGAALIQTDMRAYANPTRMVNIGKAAEDLVKKLRDFCPNCGMVGFSVSEYLRGLPCSWCGLPTDEIQSELRLCSSCGYKSTDTLKTGKADPGSCNFCNP